MKYMLIFIDSRGVETIIEECLEKQESMDKADDLQKSKDDGYYVVMDEELKEVVYETELSGGEGL